MAKLTLTDGTIFEGTTEEIFAITERYNGTKSDEPTDKPVDTITHNGVEYTLVDRKAQEGDVVVPTAGSSSLFVIKDKPYIVETGCDGRLEIEGYSVYAPQYNRTTDTVLVYAPKAEALKVGDYAVVTGNTPSVGKVVKLIKAWYIASGKFDVTPVGTTEVKGIHINNLRKATDEEVAEAKDKAEASAEQARKEAVFTQAGRKPNEYRKGDIVRADKALSGDCDGMVGVVEDVVEGAIGVRFFGGLNSYRGVMFDEGGKATLIATVESRLDRN